MRLKRETIWRSPEEIIEIGFQRSQVAMMNEAHSGWKRCVRTRQIGQRILPTAHHAGVRHLAMEALFPWFAEQCNKAQHVPEGDFGYLSQPDMKDFIQTALDLGWTLLAYEADEFKWLSVKHGIDFSTSDGPEERSRRLQEFQSEFAAPAYTNWREEQQALNLTEALQSLPRNTPLLVWCGNNHHSKRTSPDWLPMGYQFKKHSHINPFVIDQIWTVKFDARDSQLATELIMQFSDELTKHGGTAGFLIDELSSAWAHYSFQHLGDDALLFSTQNELE
jgi:hypothetical protein